MPKINDIIKLEGKCSIIKIRLEKLCTLVCVKCNIRTFDVDKLCLKWQLLLRINEVGVHALLACIFMCAELQLSRVFKC